MAVSVLDQEVRRYLNGLAGSVSVAEINWQPLRDELAAGFWKFYHDNADETVFRLFGLYPVKLRRFRGWLVKVWGQPDSVDP